MYKIGEVSQAIYNIRVRVVSDTQLSPSVRICLCWYNTGAHVVHSTY